ncbi:hypothetical protein EB1_05440 [Empedobacter brevis NBRC 14943 = ATCC 43319]|uniref:DUF4935 domain-containing protein n=1 Tax=Empedobacter brevis NBRC 14943 = ATCC 43319 TaxID=1218108 RepID=A0A511ND62_9FLAO|nr:PIN domain-containing protein [Empedobacter brevis]GEM50754.1 hypothetical protein EB1_05440 [Empedobacter brevis NBRC 14943 = ATCC 43319]
MNIFIDTSILFTDPFFKEIFKKEVLNACRLKRVNIFISEVVIKELLHNYEKNLDKIIIDIKNININSSKQILDFHRFPVPDKQNLIKQLESFFENLSKLSSFHILPINNDFLPIVLEKAIKRLKPFTEKKTEIKDALIWQTYITHINENRLENCYLLTQNVNDFGQKQVDETFIIHPELQKECSKIILINSFKEIHKIHNSYFEKQQEENKQKFISWLEKENINEDYVHNILWDNYIDKVADNISNYIERVDLDKYFEESHLINMGGYAEINEFHWGNCSEVEIEVLEENAIISGILEVSGEIQGYGYNSVRDPGDDKFPFIGSEDAEFKVYFNFLIDEDGIHDFEITDVHDI